MFSPSEYGFAFGGNEYTSASYYWNGIKRNFAKYPNLGNSVEVGYLTGLTAIAPLGCNLGTRKAMRAYSDMSASRFLNPLNTELKYVGRFGLSRVAWTIDPGGQFYPPINPNPLG